MGQYTRDLRDLGYEPTERESPFDDDGELWTNSFELVCDETAIVIRKDGSGNSGVAEDSPYENRYEYKNSGRVKMMGGYPSSYEWGESDGIFDYDVEPSQ